MSMATPTPTRDALFISSLPDGLDEGRFLGRLDEEWAERGITFMDAGGVFNVPEPSRYEAMYQRYLSRPRPSPHPFSNSYSYPFWRRSR